jgi:hypothetical protein
MARMSLGKSSGPVDMSLRNQSLEADAEQKYCNESESGSRKATPSDAMAAACSL